MKMFALALCSFSFGVAITSVCYQFMILPVWKKTAKQWKRACEKWQVAAYRWKATCDVLITKLEEVS